MNRICDSNIVVKERYGSQGFNSVIYQVCVEGDCRYLAKAISLDSNFENEAKIYKIASDAGIAPKLLDVFRCDGVGFIVMERIYTRPIGPSNFLLQGIRARLVDLLKVGIIHFDTRLDNVLLSVGAPKLYIIDYGHSYHVSDLTPDEILEKISDMKIFMGGQEYNVPVPAELVMSLIEN